MVIILSAFISILARLPMAFLYWVSDGLYFLVYHVLGYRKKIVRENIAFAFPEKTKTARDDIERKFYRHLCDVVVESIKLFRISEQELQNRCVLEENSKKMLERYKAEKKSLVLVSGHCGNWEWVGSAFSIQAPYPLTVSFLEFSSERINALLYRMRTRFGTRVISAKEIVKDIIRNKNERMAIGFIADQTPPKIYDAYWTDFMNRETNVFKGSEQIATKFNYPVLFIHIKKLKRGYYEISTEILSETPGSLKPGELTEMHTRMLEKDIRLQPWNWLWSHKRWKHKRNL